VVSARSRLSRARRPVGRAARQMRRRLDQVVGGPARSQVILVLAAVLALNSADTATVGAAATQLRRALHISNTDIGLLVAVTSVVAAVASLPFGVLVDKTRRTRLLAGSIVLWGVAMVASAAVSSFGSLLLVRLGLGAVTAVAGPAVASLVGDYFPAAERGKIYSYILTGELLGAGFGFVITGDVAALSWRAAFVILALPAGFLMWAVHKLPEPARGGADQLAVGASAFGASISPPASPPGEAPRVGAPTGGERAGPPGPGAAGANRPGGPGEEVPSETDVQRAARARGISPNPRLVLRRDPRRMRLAAAVRYVLVIRTNVILIVAGTCGYFFLAGVETFGLEFSRSQYGIGQALATLLMLLIGGGSVVGVLAGGRVADWLVHRGHLNGRLLVAAFSAAATVLLFVPALTTRSVTAALPWVVVAALALTAQNPAIDAARLDIMPPLLWGRAEGVRTALRTGGQALAPLLFGALSDLLGGGRAGLQDTFLIMLLPLAIGAAILFRGLRTYPTDVATAAASAAATSGKWAPRRRRIHRHLA